MADKKLEDNKILRDNTAPRNAGVVRDPRNNVASSQTSVEQRASSEGRRRVKWRDSTKDVLKTFGVELDKEYQYRIVNDDPITGKLHAMQERGYEFVSSTGISVGSKDASRASNVGNVCSVVVGADRNGNPLVGYLMRIRKEYAEEDARDKERATAELESSISSEWENGDKSHYVKRESHSVAGSGTMIESNSDE